MNHLIATANSGAWRAGMIRECECILHLTDDRWTAVGTAIIKEPIELLLVRGLFVRYVIDLVDDEQIPLQPVEGRGVGQLVLADHLRAISEDLIFSGSFRVQVWGGVQ